MNPAFVKLLNIRSAMANYLSIELYKKILICYLIFCSIPFKSIAQKSVADSVYFVDAIMNSIKVDETGKTITDIEFTEKYFSRKFATYAMKRNVENKEVLEVFMMPYARKSVVIVDSFIASRGGVFVPYKQKDIEKHGFPKVLITPETILKTEDGIILPYSIGSKLISSDDYRPRTENLADVKSAFILVRRSDQEKRLRDSILSSRTLMPPTTSNTTFKTGQIPSSFNERDMEGNKWKLKDLKGKVVVLNFWFVNCPPCRSEIPKLNQIVQTYTEDKNIVFIAIALDDASSIKDFLKTNPYNYHIIDNARYICDQYSVKSYPTNVVLNKQGAVVLHTSGLSGSTIPAIKKAVEEALK